MRRQVDQKLRVNLRLDSGGRRARSHQPIVELDIGGGEMRDEGRIQSLKALSSVEVGERESVLENEPARHAYHPVSAMKNASHRSGRQP